MKEETYRAIQVTEPGKFELVERTVTQPPPGKVRIRLEACGVCHSDVLTVQGVFPGISYPRWRKIPEPCCRRWAAQK